MTFKKNGKSFSSSASSDNSDDSISIMNDVSSPFPKHDRKSTQPLNDSFGEFSQIETQPEFKIEPSPEKVVFDFKPVSINEK
jgi:hypothetical protein